jgi:vacuolar-type H+-ATPase subunit I/STV1
MWDASSRGRFQYLRGRELAGELSEAEQAELAQLIRELEDLEAARLAPTLERLRQENARLTTEAAHLRRQEQELGQLLQQKEAYLARARALVVELEEERVDLLARFARIVGEPLHEAEATSASSG